MIHEIRSLLLLELKSEWRQKHAISGILLYIVSTVFVCYLSFKRVVDIPTWNALFWIIILFAAVNAISRSFSGISRGQWLYLYTIASPVSVITAKILFNGVLMLVLSLVSLFVYSLLLGNPVQEDLIFVASLSLGSIGLSSILTVMAGIAAKAGNNLTLTAVLSFPVILPLLLSLNHLSKAAADGLTIEIAEKYMLITLSIDIIVFVLAYLLFPYLWRD